MRFGFMNVILINSDDRRHVSATHVVCARILKYTSIWGVGITPQLKS